MKEFLNQKVMTDEEMPGFWVSFFSALLPVILITVSTVAGFLLPEENEVKKILGYIGNPVIAMLISVLFSIYTLGIARGRKITDIMNSLAHSVTTITMIMLTDSRCRSLETGSCRQRGKQIYWRTSESVYSFALFLGWLIATILRFCVGQLQLQELQLQELFFRL